MAQGLEEKKRFCICSAGGRRQILAMEKLALMQKVPFYAIKDSPVNESLCLFDPEEDGPILEEEHGIRAACAHHHVALGGKG